MSPSATAASVSGWRPAVWLVIGLLGLLACAVGAIWDTTSVLSAYLPAWLFFLGLTLGSLGALMIHELTGGSWSQPVRRYFEGALVPLPLLAILFIPLAMDTSHVLVRASPVRAAVILLAWVLLARSWRRGRQRTTLSALGLIVYVFTVTVAAVDWIGSLEPKWSSTALGLIVLTGQGLGAFAFAVSCATLDDKTSRLTADQCGDLGNLLLTFVMTWMYLAFMQFLIIWAEDIPRETSWYLPRVNTSWGAVTIALVLAQFAIPFALLLFRSVKRNPRGLAVIAVLLLAAHWLDVSWLVTPSLQPTGLAFRWTDIAATLGIGGVWMYVCARHSRHPRPAGERQ
jgi:hypothetical protein